MLSRFLIPVEGTECPVPLPVRIYHIEAGRPFFVFAAGHRRLKVVELADLRFADAFACEVFPAALAVNSLVFVFHNQYSFLNKNRFTVVFIFRL